MADLTPKTINELSELSSMTDNDIFLVSRSGASKKTLWSTIKQAIFSSPVPIDKGGTGATSATNAKNNLGLSNVSFTEGVLTPGSSVDVACPVYEYGVIFVLSAATSKCCVVLYRSRDGSAITPLVLGNPESITITPGVNKITFSSSAGTAQTVYIKMVY